MSHSSAHSLLPGVPLIESPLFDRALQEMALSDTERAIAVDLHMRGFAAFDFPDPDIVARIDRIIGRLGPKFGIDYADPDAIKTGANLRLQDAWLYDEDVRAIAANGDVLDLLSRLYGRRAFPFQTLNFPVGTQQTAHSDSVHFSSLPPRFMCGVWLAFEDIHPDSGPLLYYPGSHHWPVPSNAMLGETGRDRERISAQAPFEPFWHAMLEATQCQAETFLARKGQALIWSANLLHGGSPHIDPRRTRWSQVTHYYFDDCIYYTPAYSDEATGNLDLRTIIDVATGEIVPNRYHGEIIKSRASRKSGIGGWLSRLWGQKLNGLPSDFDAEVYCQLNPDIVTTGADPARHYLEHGQLERRRYKL